jgi:hypothetical protein
VTISQLNRASNSVLLLSKQQQQQQQQIFHINFTKKIINSIFFVNSNSTFSIRLMLIVCVFFGVFVSMRLVFFFY